MVKKLFYYILFLFISVNIFSQKISKDNYTGNWDNGFSWVDGNSPGINNIISDCIINGKITRIGDLDFGLGDLFINDTLIIFGNLNLGNNSNLTINDNGILIVYGNYSSSNKTDVGLSGYFVVNGEFDMKGSKNHGSFDILNGNLYIIDSSPKIKTGDGYIDLSCTYPNNYPTDCGYGDGNDLLVSPIKDLFSYPYSLMVVGASEFCGGDSIILYISDLFTNYQWYKNGIMIIGENTNTYTTYISGNYYLTFNIGTFEITTNTINTIEYDIVFLSDIISNNVLTLK